MSYPSEFYPHAQKSVLCEQYIGKDVSELPTPSFIVDRSIVKRNCERMLERAKKLNVEFRAHVKTHKTIEGALYQLGSNEIKTDKVIVSTLAEARFLSPLIRSGQINDLLFSLPVVKSKLSELADLSLIVPHLRIMLDNEDQLHLLKKYNESNNRRTKWSVFIKVDMGTHRAGITNNSPALNDILTTLFSTEIAEHVELYGFYCHAGHSYGSRTKDRAKSLLIEEIESANTAAKLALSLNPTLQLQISVGATPTAHASELLDISSLSDDLVANLELHAGNYPFCDLQQVSTNCVSIDKVACKVLAEVVSHYPGRGDEPGEILINTGVVALSRETSFFPGFGKVCSSSGDSDWIVGRLSQEHGILTPINESAKFIELGEKIFIIPNHSCITAAAFPYFLVVDDGDIIVDVWVTGRGW